MVAANCSDDLLGLKKKCHQDGSDQTSTHPIEKSDSPEIAPEMSTPAAYSSGRENVYVVDQCATHNCTDTKQQIFKIPPNNSNTHIISTQFYSEHC